jgi:hypothetical protein
MGAGNVRGLTLHNWRVAVVLAALLLAALVVPAVSFGAAGSLAHDLASQPAASAPVVAAAPQSPQGDYTLQRVSDAGARADGIEIPDVWMEHGRKVERIFIRGAHRLDPRTYGREGFAHLRFDIQRK